MDPEVIITAYNNSIPISGASPLLNRIRWYPIDSTEDVPNTSANSTGRLFFVIR